jgi:hypothetical protein
MDIPRGYSLAGRITTGFDGGNHPIKGNVWVCLDCGSLIAAGHTDVHDRFHAQIDGLLEAANQNAAPAVTAATGPHAST